MLNNNSTISIRNIVIFLIIISVFAPARLFEIAGIPITMQTLVILSCAYFMKPKETAICLSLYLVFGALNLPVFAGYSGGWEKLIGQYGGFLWSFLIVAVLLSYFKPENGSMIRLFMAFLIAHLLILFIGYLWQYVYLCVSGNEAEFGLDVFRMSIPVLLKSMIAVLIVRVVELYGRSLDV